MMYIDAECMVTSKRKKVAVHATKMVVMLQIVLFYRHCDGEGERLNAGRIL